MILTRSFRGVFIPWVWDGTDMNFNEINHQNAYEVAFLVEISNSPPTVLLVCFFFFLVAHLPI